jgi:CheY-like chemotaxis protein
MDGVSILVVDDDATTLRSVQRALAGDACAVTETTSVGAARTLDGRFDVGVFSIDLGALDLAEELLLAGRVGQAMFLSGAMWQAPLRRAVLLGPVLPRGYDPSEFATELRRLMLAG